MPITTGIPTIPSAAEVALTLAAWPWPRSSPLPMGSRAKWHNPNPWLAESLKPHPVNASVLFYFILFLLLFSALFRLKLTEISSLMKQLTMDRWSGERKSQREVRLHHTRPVWPVRNWPFWSFVIKVIIFKMTNAIGLSLTQPYLLLALTLPGWSLTFCVLSRNLTMATQALKQSFPYHSNSRVHLLHVQRWPAPLGLKLVKYFNTLSLSD